MTNKYMKAFKRKKIPLISEKQGRARLRFARKYSKLTAEDWENFLFTDECPDSSGVRRSPGIPGEAKSEGDGVGRYNGS